MLSPRETAAAESWNRTLLTVPTLIGRLDYLSGLRNVNTGTYEHAGLAQRMGEASADSILRASHMSVFQEWLCLELGDQKREITEYFSGLDGTVRTAVATWVRLEPFRHWVPEESRDVERELFYSDLAVVLELMRAEFGVASRDRDS